MDYTKMSVAKLTLLINQKKAAIANDQAQLVSVPANAQLQLANAQITVDNLTTKIAEEQEDLTAMEAALAKFPATN